MILPSTDELARALYADRLHWHALTDDERDHWRGLADRVRDYLAERLVGEHVPSPRVVDVYVPGVAAPQGSKRYLGKGVSVESGRDRVDAWRTDVRDTVAPTRDGRPPLLGAVGVDLEFVLKRPLRTPMARTPPAVKRPDLDKLERAVLDAISSAGVWRDDCQVVDLRGHKRLAAVDETPGCHVRVTPL